MFENLIMVSPTVFAVVFFGVKPSLSDVSVHNVGFGDSLGVLRFCVTIGGTA